MSAAASSSGGLLACGAGAGTSRQVWPCNPAPQHFDTAVAQQARLLVGEPPMVQKLEGKREGLHVESKSTQRRAGRECRASPGARCLRRPRRRAGLHCSTQRRAPSSRTSSPWRCGDHTQGGAVRACRRCRRLQQPSGRTRRRRRTRAARDAATTAATSLTAGAPTPPAPAADAGCSSGGSGFEPHVRAKLLQLLHAAPTASAHSLLRRTSASRLFSGLRSNQLRPPSQALQLGAAAAWQACAAESQGRATRVGRRRGRCCRACRQAAGWRGRGCAVMRRRCRCAAGGCCGGVAAAGFG